MRKHQTGEIHVAVMIVMMLSMMWFGSGHMGMRDDGAAKAEKSGSTKQQAPAESLPSLAQKESNETQN